MALKDALARVNHKLKETFHLKPHDPHPGRKKLIQKLKTARKQVEEGRHTAPNRIWEVGYDAVSITPQIDGHVVVIEEETWHTMTSDQLIPFIDDLIDAVEKGELDAAIKDAQEGKSPRADSLSSLAGKTKSKGGTGKRNITDVGRIRMAINGRRRGGASDAEIKAALIAEGKDKALVERAFKPA